MEFLQIEKIKSTKFPLKPILSKISFELGKNPVVEKKKKYDNYIPKPYKAVLMISADFELAWAFRFSKHQKDPVANAKYRALRARKNIPEILGLCDKYNVPITWATVGHLFLDSCTCNEGKAHSNLEKLEHFESPFWKFDSGDWFKDDPCSNYKNDPEWYAPDLIKSILASKTKHEIGSHTFSHIDCRESICSPSVFDSELNECVKVAEPYGLKLKSFVFPGHTFGNFDRLPNHGFESYRTNYKNTLGFPVKHNNGLWEHKSSAEFNIRPTWSVEYQIYRFKKIIDRAIHNHTNCHFWFHPSVNSQFVSDIMPEILEYIDQKRNEIFVTTMGEYTHWLNNNNGSMTS